MTQPLKTSSILAVFFFASLLIFAEGYPKIRNVKDHRRRLSGAIENALATPSKADCDRTVPCGWALYQSQSKVSPLRPIYEYTRNTFCDCPLTTECVYKENRHEMRAYVFYCTPSSEVSDGAYRFPSKHS